MGVNTSRPPSLQKDYSDSDIYTCIYIYLLFYFLLKFNSKKSLNDLVPYFAICLCIVVTHVFCMSCLHILLLDRDIAISKHHFMSLTMPFSIHLQTNPTTRPWISHPILRWRLWEPSSRRFVPRRALSLNV